MLKTFAPLLAIAMSASPFAMAESGEPITVNIEYEAALLVSDDGAREVLKSIKSQARTACTSTQSMASKRAVDHDCARAIVADSISEIVAKRDAAGLETAPTFAKRASFVVAALEQR